MCLFPQCVCVWFLPTLSISRPPLVLSSSSANKQHEGGYNWEVQSSARWNHLYVNTGSRSLSRPLLAYCVTATLSLTFYSASLLLPSYFAHSSVCVTDTVRQSFAAASTIFTSFALFFFCAVIHVDSRQCNSTPCGCQPPHTAQVLKELAKRCH